MKKLNHFYSKIAGTTFQQGSQDIIRTLKPGHLLFVKREKDNKYDKNAIAIYSDETHKLGYVPKDTAETLAPKMDDPKIILIFTVSEVTGRDKDNVGCNIHIEIYDATKETDDEDF